MVRYSHERKQAVLGSKAKSEQWSAQAQMVEFCLDELSRERKSI